MTLIGRASFVFDTDGSHHKFGARTHLLMTALTSAITSFQSPSIQLPTGVKQYFRSVCSQNSNPYRVTTFLAKNAWDAFWHSDAVSIL
jgi:hypothetical protein